MLLSQAAGYVGYRTIAIGLRAGLIAALADAPDGLTPGELATAVDVDPFYAAVWCRGAYGSGALERTGTGLTDASYRLAPHIATLLLDTSSPAYAGGVFATLEQREVFDRFEETLTAGTRMWWDDTRPEWITAVAGTGRPFYTRLVPGGLDAGAGPGGPTGRRRAHPRHRLRRRRRVGPPRRALPGLRHRRRGRRRALDRPSRRAADRGRVCATGSSWS